MSTAVRATGRGGAAGRREASRFGLAGPPTSRQPAARTLWRGSRLVPRREVGGGSDWVTFRDEEGDQEDRDATEKRTSEWDEDFAFRASTLTQNLVRRTNEATARLSQTIIVQFGLRDVSEEFVALVLRGALVIVGLTFLRLILGLVLGVVALGFAALLAWRYMYGYTGKGGREGDENDRDWFDAGGGGSGGGRGNGGSGGGDDVVDVRFYD